MKTNFISNKEKKTKALHEKYEKGLNNKNKKSYTDKKLLDEIKLNDAYINTDEFKMIVQENNKVIKDNKLIQKATFDFTEYELKCLNYVLSLIKPDIKITENDYIEFPLIDLIKILGIKNNSKQYEIVKESLSNLRTKNKWVKIKNKNIDKEINLSFLMKCEILNNGNKSNVRVKFMNEILYYIQNLKRKFTEMNLIYSLMLKGKYTIRLYELCKSYQNNLLIDNEVNENKIYGFNLYVKSIREMWCIPDTVNTGNFKRQILDKAINEINSKTDIDISIFKTHKNGHTIDYYILQVKPNTYIFNSVIKKIEKRRKEILYE